MSAPNSDKPLVLDLFCGEGGAAKGYLDAGFDVIGVDSNPKMGKRYPGMFICADWKDVVWEGNMYARWADLIHASPPCQRYSAATRKADKLKHPDLIKPVRTALRWMGVPFVIENVPGAPLQDPAELCGCMFGLGAVHRGQYFALYRPRLFEAHGFKIATLAHCEHFAPALPAYGHGAPGRMYRQGEPWKIPAVAIKAGMGTPWMTRDGCAQSIPPAFTEFIGQQFLDEMHAYNKEAA